MFRVNSGWCMVLCWLVLHGWCFWFVGGLRFCCVVVCLVGGCGICVSLLVLRSSFIKTDLVLWWLLAVNFVVG